MHAQEWLLGYTRKRIVECSGRGLSCVSYRFTNCERARAVDGAGREAPIAAIAAAAGGVRHSRRGEQKQPTAKEYAMPIPWRYERATL